MLRSISHLRRRVLLWRKNTFVREHVRAYIAAHDAQPLPPRETEFRLEVVIPCFNHGRFLAAALASIPSGHPITVIDDASTDDTFGIAEELRSRFDFRLLRNSHSLLQWGSLNRAIETSNSNLFVVLNADDCMVPYGLGTAVALLQAHRSIRLVGGGSIPFSDPASLRLAASLPAKLAYLPKPRVYNVQAAREYRAPNDINMSMSGSAFLRSAWQTVGGFAPFAQRVCAYDDRDFQMKVSCFFDVGVIDEPLCFYRVYSSLGRGEYMG